MCYNLTVSKLDFVMILFTDSMKLKEGQVKWTIGLQ
jgi:hypothetical protein